MKNVGLLDTDTKRVGTYGEISAINALAFNTQTGNYTLQSTDGNSGVSMNSASAVNLTVPPNSSVAFAVGTQVVVRQQGAGAVTIVAGSGVTLQGAATGTSAQWATVVLVKEATDTWFVVTGQKGDTGVNGSVDPVGLNNQTASYTLVLSDGSKLIRMNVASANNLTVPPNSSVAFPLGTRLAVNQQGAGQTTIVAGAGVTLRSFGSALKLAGQYASAMLIKVDTDTWIVEGNLST